MDIQIYHGLKYKENPQLRIWVNHQQIRFKTLLQQCIRLENHNSSFAPIDNISFFQYIIYLYLLTTIVGSPEEYAESIEMVRCAIVVSHLHVSSLFAASSD